MDTLKSWTVTISPEQLPTTIKNVVGDIIGLALQHEPNRKQYTEEELLDMPYGAIAKKFVEKNEPELLHWQLTWFIDIIKDNDKLNCLVPSLTALVEEGLKQGILKEFPEHMK
ncbi:MAG: hypothetical protein ACP5N7_06470 [Candidatus Pacearchaeota archaeon]